MTKERENNLKAASELAKSLIKIDLLNNTEAEDTLRAAADDLLSAEREIERLRALVLDLAADKLTQAQKNLLLV